jgi:RNA-directed DNA polymerase
MILEALVRETQLRPGYILSVARTASHRYKTYSIPKASGGERVIHHPARELKLFQSWLAKNIFSHFPTHAAAFAYRPGRSIRHHAELHRRNNYILKVDFAEFFPSITAHDIRLVATRHSDKFDQKLT